MMLSFKDHDEKHNQTFTGSKNSMLYPKEQDKKFIKFRRKTKLDLNTK